MLAVGANESGGQNPGFVIVTGCAWGIAEGVILDNDWHHYAFVTPDVSGTTIGEAIIYQDGIPYSFEENCAGCDDLITTLNDEELFIGKNIASNNPNFFNGNVDQLAIWNTVLTTDQIMDLVNCSTAIDENESEEYWDFENTDNIK